MSCPFVALNPLVDLVKMTWMLTIDGAPVYLRVDQEMLGHCGNIKKTCLLLECKITKLLPVSLLDVMLNNYFALNCVFILKKTEEEKTYTHCNVFLKNYEGFFTLFS